MDDKKISFVKLCNLSKAFHTVHHEILRHKLSKVNVDSIWFRDYLHDISQAVEINDVRSDTSQTTLGVPQTPY